MLFDPSETPTWTSLNEARDQARCRGAHRRHFVIGWSASTVVHVTVASCVAVWVLLNYWNLIENVQLSGSRRVVSLELTMTDNKVSMPAAAASATTPVRFIPQKALEELEAASLPQITPQPIRVARQQSAARVRPRDASDRLMADVSLRQDTDASVKAPVRISTAAEPRQTVVQLAAASGGQQRPSVAALPKTAVGFDEKAAQVIFNPYPIYPAEAIRLGIAGRVVLRLTVSEEGTVSNVTIASSSGYYVLDDAAMVGVRQWRYVAATRGGRPVSSFIRQPVRFLPPS